VRGRRLTVRAIALLAAGSAAIHQLRYAIGYGDAAPHALATHGHGYLIVALPGVMTVALIALAGVLMRAAGGRSRPLDDARRINASLPALWLAATIALALIYGTQETIEGSGAFAGGGWIGLALAVPAGFLVALALGGAEAAESLRPPGAALRAFVYFAAPHGTRRSALFHRAAQLRLGARAPPVAFVA
jgi:hypothetical protein